MENIEMVDWVKNQKKLTDLGQHCLQENIHVDSERKY